MKNSIDPLLSKWHPVKPFQSHWHLTHLFFAPCFQTHLNTLKTVSFQGWQIYTHTCLSGFDKEGTCFAQKCNKSIMNSQYFYWAEPLFKINSIKVNKNLDSFFLPTYPKIYISSFIKFKKWHFSINTATLLEHSSKSCASFVQLKRKITFTFQKGRSC